MFKKTIYSLVTISLVILSVAVHAALDQDHEAVVISALQVLDVPILKGKKTTKNVPDLLGKVKLQTEKDIKLRRGNNPNLYLCETCHSRSMALSNNYLPILHGQNQDYLLKKMQMFKNNADSMHPFRSDFERLDTLDMVDLSQFYAKQQSPLTDQWVSTPNLETNQPQKQTVTEIDRCRVCHGQGGKGDAMVPVISGQNLNYLAYRIREISQHHSRVHVEPDDFVNCDIERKNIRQSRELAASINLVVNTERVSTGEPVYQQNCAQCHERNESIAPVTSDGKFWSERLRLGTQMLFSQTIKRHSHDYPEQFNSLSIRQRIDAFHFMIKQISLSAS